MDDNRVINNDLGFVDEEWGGTDYKNLEAPTKWRFDENTGKLHMLFKDGGIRLLCATARLNRVNDFYQIGTLASSQEVLLWDTNHTDKLDASCKRVTRA